MRLRSEEAPPYRPMTGARTRPLWPYSSSSLSTGPLWSARVSARTRTRTNTNPNGTEANAAGRSGNARALRKLSKCGMIQEGEGHWVKFAKSEVFLRQAPIFGCCHSAEQ